MKYSNRLFACWPISIRKISAAVVLITGLSAAAMKISSVAHSEGIQFDPSVAVFKPSESVDWTLGTDGVNTAQGYGDREAGEYGSFVTFPPEFVSPIHSHTNAYHGVVITGIVINPMAAEGDAPRIQLGPGSYWFVPAGEVHTTACVSEIPCTFYTHSSVFFDFVQYVE